MAQVYRPWHFDDEIYLLTTKDSGKEMSKKLGRGTNSIFTKLSMMKRNGVTVERLEYEKDFIINNLNEIRTQDIADTLGYSITTINNRIFAMRKRGDIGEKSKIYKDAEYYDKSDKLYDSMDPVQKKSYYPKNCIRLNELEGEKLNKGTKIRSGNNQYKVIEDYGAYVLCERNGFKECFQKVDLKIKAKNMPEVI